MEPHEFRRLQDALGWTNMRMAEVVMKTPQSISNYRCGRQKIPKHVVALLHKEVQSLRDKSLRNETSAS